MQGKLNQYEDCANQRVELSHNLHKTRFLSGRYGDPLNPWGDIITIAQAWCASTEDV